MEPYLAFVAAYRSVPPLDTLVTVPARELDRAWIDVDIPGLYE